MKASRYNFWCDVDSSTRLLFNSSTVALAEVDADSFAAIHRLLENPCDIHTDADRELVRQLEYGGYLVADDPNELQRLRLRNRTHRLSGDAVTLTIAPTLACNFACDYCFESGAGGSMSRDTEVALLQFADAQFQGAQKSLVTWFGGEPTLCMETIERLQEGLWTAAERAQVMMEPASIITNGYLLSRNLAGRLAGAGVTRAQVTLDGAASTHDRRRRLRGGQGTFARIVSNLHASADVLQILVRVNIDPENAGDACDLAEFLEREGLLHRVRIYFAPVVATAGACADLTGRCYTTAEFARWQVDLYRRLIARGMHQIEYPALAPGGHCGADAARGFVIAPSGLLFKCWEEVALGPTRAVGHVEGGALDACQQANLARYTEWDPFAIKECVECPTLPICMGGCPSRGLEKGSRTEGYCTAWRFNLQEMLALRYLCDQTKEVDR